MRDEIRALQQRLKLTVAYVTHDQSEALAVSDQIIVMHEGNIAQAGSPSEMYERPNSEFVAGFMGEAMLLPAVGSSDGTVSLGPLRIQPKTVLQGNRIKVAVRPEAWRVGEAEVLPLAATVLKSAYLGGFYEYTFVTEIGELFVVCPEVDKPRIVGDRVSLALRETGVSVIAA